MNSSESLKQIEIRATRYYKSIDKESWICNLYSYLINITTENNKFEIKLLMKQETINHYYEDILYIDIV